MVVVVVVVAVGTNAGKGGHVGGGRHAGAVGRITVQSGGRNSEQEKAAAVTRTGKAGTRQEQAGAIGRGGGRRLAVDG